MYLQRMSGFPNYVNNSDGLPPPYTKSQEPRTGSRWSPKAWTRKVTIGVFAIAAGLLAVIIIAAVLGSRANAYPDYSPLHYTLVDTYSGRTFFDNFNYFTGYDATAGFVHYVPRETAMSEQYNLTYAGADSAILRVDTSETDASTGRFSVRIESKKQYNSGLFVFDILNTPYGCSTWPALWLTDQSNWPEHGEIDVVEAVNQANNGNQMTLHTSRGCKMDVKRKETGSSLTKNCWNETEGNAGCGVQGKQDTYGQSFNANGGGIYAMAWRHAGIRIWFFGRSNIPSDIPADLTNTSAPNPDGWGKPLADFPNTHCDIGNHFKNQSIIANIDLCGTWAGDASVYSKEDFCPGQCTDF
ncbi:hypothetical protein LTR37_006085 [Vermiconidia calcicola]|uniref:Uncharacterized protein n=1 Tax=Vermiconidia calcicola TaxID=1690605 RepID=A0ACC3NHC0_9PEZI|nr:hypothetical protein LTR37_006085 [Vermiconidia calcicola]